MKATSMTTKHALIIDDNPINIDVLSMMLAQEGLTYTAVQTPLMLDIVINALERIDVIFLDLELPYLNGMQVLADLRGNPRLAGVPIVAYTVHISEIDAARRAGFHSFLGKPLSVKRFPDQLESILHGNPVWDIS